MRIQRRAVMLLAASSMLMGVALSAPTALAEPPGGEPDTPSITQTVAPSGPQQPGEQPLTSGSQEPSITTPGSQDQTAPSAPADVPSTNTSSSEAPTTSETPSTSTSAPPTQAPGKRLAPLAVTAGCQTYPPTSFQVCGLIRDKYNQMNGPASFLLFPKSNELTNPGNTGKRTEFLGGNIYWSAATGAHPVAHEFLTKWGEKGYETGYLKYPTTDEIVLPQQGGRRQEYTGGSIYWSPLTGAHTIQGAIKDKWVALGAQGGALGYPTSDEIVAPDGIGRFNNFQNGSIYWSPATGAHPVSGAIQTIWAAEGFEAGEYGYPTGDPIAVNGNPKKFQQTFQHGDIVAGTLFSMSFDWVPADLEFGDALTCQLEGVGDDVHVSSTPPRTASGHAWWVKVNDYCPDDLRADITAQLQVINEQGTYRNVGDVAYKLNTKPNGGSTYRANPRVTCADDQLLYWRMEIDIDVIGYQDPPTKEYSWARTAECDA